MHSSSVFTGSSVLISFPLLLPHAGGYSQGGMSGGYGGSQPPQRGGYPGEGAGGYDRPGMRGGPRGRGPMGRGMG